MHIPDAPPRSSFFLKDQVYDVPDMLNTCKLKLCSLFYILLYLSCNFNLEKALNTKIHSKMHQALQTQKIVFSAKTNTSRPQQFTNTIIRVDRHSPPSHDQKHLLLDCFVQCHTMSVLLTDDWLEQQSDCPTCPMLFCFE